MIYRINVDLAMVWMSLTALVMKISDLRGAVGFVLYVTAMYQLVMWGRERKREMNKKS